MKYSLIYADPPWTYRDKANDGERGAAHKYPCMSLLDLMHLPVWDLAADNCLLAMWWVPTMPTEAIKLTETWGFRLATMKGFTWAKGDLARGKFPMGMGHYTRANTEDCLFAVRGNWRGMRQSAAVRQLVVSPRREHSQKPDEVAERLVQLVGDVQRVELFARAPRAGWHVWGNEVTSSPDVEQVLEGACRS